MSHAAGGGLMFAKGLLAYDLPKGTEIVRIHQSDKGPIFFGPAPGRPPGNRFDAPAGQYRVLYGAAELPGAFVETVLRRPGRILRRDEVNARAFSRLEIQRPLRLAKLFDEGLQWHGIDAGAISVDDYDVSRQLAIAFHARFADVDGVAYRSRYNNGQICYALFDRVQAGELVAKDALLFLDRPDVVDDLMHLHGAVFDTSPLP